MKSGIVVFFLATNAFADAPPCTVEYDLSAQLTISDTPLGQGNGTHAIGPGRAVVRFDGPNVQLLAYSMHATFAVRPRTAFWRTTVVTDVQSEGTPDERGIVATGTFDGQRIHWTTPLRGYHTDGTLDCSGAFCGKFTAPPHGKSPLQIGPAPQPFSDWTFAPDGKSFAMPKTQFPRTQTPKQSSAVAISGTEAKRTCAPAKAPSASR
jgi:hypothetical protein